MWAGSYQSHLWYHAVWCGRVLLSVLRRAAGEADGHPDVQVV